MSSYTKHNRQPFVLSPTTFWYWLSLFFGLGSLYFPLFFSHFQQDEWHNLGYHLYGLSQHGFWPWLASLWSKPLAVTQTLNLVSYSLFGIQVAFPFLVVVVLLCVNIVLWTQLVFSLTKKRSVGVLSATFASVSYLSLQAVSWVLVAMAIQLSLLAILLALLLNYSAVRAAEINWLKLGLSFGIGLAAFGIKFHSVFVLPLLLLTSLVWMNWQAFFSENRKRKLTLLIATLAFGTLLIGMVGYSQRSHPRLSGNIKTIMASSFFTLTAAPGQIVADYPPFFYRLSESVTTQYFGLPLNHEVSYGPVVLALMLGLSVIVFVFFAVVTLIPPNSNKEFVAILFGLGLFVFGLSPYMLDTVSVGLGFLESRYYHPAAFGFWLLFFLLIQKLRAWLEIKFPSFKLVWFGVFMMVVSLWLGVRAYTVSDRVQTIQAYTAARVELLSFVDQELIEDSDNFIVFLHETNYPNPAVKNITGRYFQTGVLYPLLVVLADQNKVGSDFFEDDELWDLNFQGVSEKQNQVVGIFYEKAELIEHLQDRPDHTPYVVGLEVHYSALDPKTMQIRGAPQELLFATYSKINPETLQTMLDVISQEDKPNEVLY